MTVVFEVEPSPKSHDRFVIVPVELSVKVTVNGFKPLVGLPTKEATGTTAPVPVTWFVLLPPSLENATKLVNAPAAGGVKPIAIFVELKPEMVNEAGDMMENGPDVKVIVPLVSAVEPELVRTKVA